MDLIEIFRAFHSNAEGSLSSQIHTEYSQGQIKSRVTDQALVNLIKLKLDQACFLITML